MKPEKIQSVLIEMATLLRIGYRQDWADNYEHLGKQIAVAPQEACRNILASYGGMGALNDVVLQQNGKMLQAENEQFDGLRSLLHVLCSQYLASNPLVQ